MSLIPNLANGFSRIDWETRTVRDGRLLWKGWPGDSVLHRVYGWTLFERRRDQNNEREFTIRMVLR